MSRREDDRRKMEKQKVIKREDLVGERNRREVASTAITKSFLVTIHVTSFSPLSN
jgi:hypothetical protein